MCCVYDSDVPRDPGRKYNYLLCTQGKLALKVSPAGPGFGALQCSPKGDRPCSHYPFGILLAREDAEAREAECSGSR